MRDQCSSCIHKFREPHMVIMAANKTKMLSIIGLPEIARLFPHLFLDMVERFTEMSRKAQQSISVPQPVHGLTNRAFLSESEKWSTFSKPEPAQMTRPTVSPQHHILKAWPHQEPDRTANTRAALCPRRCRAHSCATCRSRPCSRR